jgi:hypothetical protein
VCGVGFDEWHGLHVHGDGYKQCRHERGVECVVCGYSVGSGSGSCACCDSDTYAHSDSDPDPDAVG